MKGAILRAVTPTRRATLPARLSLVALLALGLSAGASCHRTVDERPIPALASARSSQEKMDGVRLRWSSAGTEGRASMRAELSEFVAQLEASEDSLEPLARAYLAIAWLDAGVPAAGEAVARPLIEGPPGVAHDLGQLVKGAAARREGRSAEAITLLSPLVGKVIDPWARPLLDEELTEAYLDEGRYEEAIAAAAAWVRSASGDRAAVLARAEQVLARVPPADARRVLDAARNAAGQGGYPPELLGILDRNLARQAGVEVAVADASVDGAAASRDAAVVALAPIAESARFEGRTIALLLPSSVPSRSVLSSLVARVVATSVSPHPTAFDPSAKPVSPSALPGDAGARDAGAFGASGTRDTRDMLGARDGGLDANPAASAPLAASHRLAVFDTAGTAEGTRLALAQAEHDGAATVIGGATDPEANALAALAQAARIPVVLLRRPSAPPIVPAGARSYWVAIGPSVAEEEAATLSAADLYGVDRAVVEAVPDAVSPAVFSGLARAFADAPPDAGVRADAGAPTDDLHVRCDATPKSAVGGAFPVAAWQKRKIAVVVVLGDARCAERVLDELDRTPGYRPRVVLSPSALELVHRTSALPRVAVGAGILPAGDDAPVELRLLWRDLRAPVGWWAGLARDAAALALAATPGLPDATEPSSVARARVATLDALRGAHVALWTSGAGQIEPNGVTSRTFAPRVVGGGGSWSPAWLAD